MKITKIYPLISCLIFMACQKDDGQKNDNGLNLDQYPHVLLSNEEVEMKVFLPDPENGLYRATRFDWSGVIGSLKYKGHEYFDYWKNTHNPLIHEDLPGPVEGWIKPGLNYEEAGVGDGFIRIGIGVLEKEEEPEYGWTDTYKIIDYGKWTVDHGKDWISFTHELNSDFGYAYKYNKKITLTESGFVIYHKLTNSGDKTIETDQFNHNFFVIDQTKSGPDFLVKFPFELSTERDTKGMVELRGNEIHYLKPVEDGSSVFLELTGFSDKVTDHQATIINQKTGAGISLSVDQPIYRMAFWTCHTTLCPENFIWIKAEPGESMEWESTYSLFTR